VLACKLPCGRCQLYAGASCKAKQDSKPKLRAALAGQAPLHGLDAAGITPAHDDAEIGARLL
jgi:hypothetical protein